MTASNRTRAQLREVGREVRATARAARAVATGKPQSARTHLLASGLDTATAARFSGAFSKSVIATATTTAKVKRKPGSRKAKRVAVKLYDQDTFTARLAVYRPQDADAAARFDRVARLAA